MIEVPRLPSSVHPRHVKAYSAVRKQVMVTLARPVAGAEEIAYVDLDAVHRRVHG
jgi:hypothetical protein